MTYVEVPKDVIYGYRDMFVICGKPIEIFGEDVGENMTAHSANAAHNISKSASKYICERINATRKNNNKKLAKISQQA